MTASFGSGEDKARSPLPRTIRQIALPLVEETAGHAGEAGIIREAIDGKA